MKKQIWFLILRLIATSSLLAFFWIAPTSAQQRIDIRNVKGNVQFHKGDRNEDWLRIQSTDPPPLLPEQWLRTRSSSRADLYLRPRGTAYLQGSYTTSQFAPTAECVFLLAQGKIVYLHNRRSVVPACETRTKKASIRAPGTALFVIEDDRETTVGVLTNSPEGPVTVTGLRSGETVELRAGELASVSIDGDVRRLGEFSLRRFYRNNSLALGLGLGSEHENFVNQQPDDLQEVILEVREETLKALLEQEKERLLDNELLTPPNLEFPLRAPDVPPSPTPPSPTPIPTPPIPPPIPTPPIPPPPIPPSIPTPPIPTPPISPPIPTPIPPPIPTPIPPPTPPDPIIIPG